MAGRNLGKGLRWCLARRRAAAAAERTTANTPACHIVVRAATASRHDVEFPVTEIPLTLAKPFVIHHPLSARKSNQSPLKAMPGRNGERLRCFQLYNYMRLLQVLLAAFLILALEFDAALGRSAAAGVRE